MDHTVKRTALEDIGRFNIIGDGLLVRMWLVADPYDSCAEPLRVMNAQMKRGPAKAEAVVNEAMAELMEDGSRAWLFAKACGQPTQRGVSDIVVLRRHAFISDRLIPDHLYRCPHRQSVALWFYLR